MDLQTEGSEVPAGYFGCCGTFPKRRVEDWISARVSSQEPTSLRLGHLRSCAWNLVGKAPEPLVRRGVVCWIRYHKSSFY